MTQVQISDITNTDKSPKVNEADSGNVLPSKNQEKKSPSKDTPRKDKDKKGKESKKTSEGYLLQKSIIAKHSDIIGDLAKKPVAIKALIDKRPHSQEIKKVVLSTNALINCKEETHNLLSDLNLQFATILTDIKNCIFNIEDVKMNCNAFSNPKQRAMMDMLPIEAQDSERRNYFRTQINNISYLIQLLNSEIIVSKTTASPQSDYLTFQSLMKNITVLIKQKTLALESLRIRTNNLNQLVVGNIPSQLLIQESDDVVVFEQTREMSVVPQTNMLKDIKAQLIKRLEKGNCSTKINLNDAAVKFASPEIMRSSSRVQSMSIERESI